MRIAVLSALTVIGLMLGSSANAAVNLVSDGDFTNPSGGPQYTTYTTSFGPWNVTGSVDLIGGYWQAPGASGSVDLDGNSPGGINQNLALSSGNYFLQFDLSGNPDGGAVTKLLTASLSSVLSTSYSYDIGANTKADMDYIVEREYFTITNPGSFNLSFVSNDLNSPFGAVISDVVVSAVPEPAMWVMLIIGFGAIGSSLRLTRARRSTATAA